MKTTKYATSLSGHVYAYAVDTAAAFKKQVADAYDVATEYLHLLDPETGTDVPSDAPLQETVVYSLFLEASSRPVLCSWIDPTHLNPHLLLENPAIVWTDAELSRMVPPQLDHLAGITPHMDMLSPHLPRLTPNGWRRMFLNPAAVPLLERMYTHPLSWQYELTEHAHLLAFNTHSDTHRLLRRILDDIACGTLPPLRRPDLFWRNIASYQTHAIELLEHPIGPGHLTHMDHLCKNCNMVSSFFPLSLSLDDPRIHWENLVVHAEAAPYLLPLLEQGRLGPPRVPYSTLFYNQNPILVPFYRTLPPYEVIPWLYRLARNKSAACIALVEEYLTRYGDLPPMVSAWKSLHLNPSPEAISLLRRNPERIHWSLLCTNPSPEVIPLIEAYLTEYEEAGYAPFVSSEGASLLGYTLVRHNIRESYQGKDLWDDSHRTTLNLGALSLHPAALPLLRQRPHLLFWPSISIRPDSYEIRKGELQ